MSLDTNYNARTYLSRWWKQVHKNLLALWDRTTNEIASEQSRVNTEIANERSRVNTELNKKVDKTQYASVSQAGVIKLYSSSGANRSGLVVYEDGSAVVNTRADRGIARDGVGQIGINAATEAEIEAGTDAYKPIVPNTLKCAVESIAGKSEELTTKDKTSLTAAINELDFDIGNVSDVRIPTTTGPMVPVFNIVSAVNSLSGFLGRLLDDKITYGNAGFINNSNVLKAPTENGIIGGTKTYIPSGIYFWVPDSRYCTMCSIEYRDTDNKGLFMEGYLYILEIDRDNDANSRVLYSQYDEEQKLAKIGADKLDVNFTSNGFEGIEELTESVKYLNDGAYSNGYAGLEEITTDLKELKNKIRYSATPRKVGEWIDGTPIWRIAFKKNFTADELIDKSVLIIDLFSVNDPNVAFVVNYCVNMFFTEPCMVDDIALKISSCVISFDLDANITPGETDGICGWIEFATPENNIKIS